MRKPAFVLAALLLAGIGAVTPATAPATLAATAPKVAIIVGATHGTTAQYRSYADQVYAEAIRYTPNVVRVYSPNATWSRVKAAVNGASIVVYLGHGNGWPSPYTYDPLYTTKDGFGLNYDVNGDGKLTDYENRYYGEPSIRTLTPAPNAVVLLFHLCYASGNSEPGGAAPSLSTAKQRVDNYAAAFLRTGARAVVAIGHRHDPYYIRELFTSRQTIEDYFRNAPDFRGNLLSFASVRTPGYSIRMDPDSAAPANFYRSLTGKMDLTTVQVTGASYAFTDRDPATFVVPGNASPLADGAPLFGTVEAAVAGVEPAGTLPATERIRIEYQEGAVSQLDGSAIFRVRTDTDAEGWMTASALTPRDSTAPRVWDVDTGAGTLSPNGDGRQDTLPITIRLSEPSDWTLRVVDPAGRERASSSGEGDTAALTFAPESAADGWYRWEIRAEDGWGNGPLRSDGGFRVDTTAPQLSVADVAAMSVPVFSPNGDGYRDTIGFPMSATEPGRILATVRDAAGAEVAGFSSAIGTSTTTLAWNGRNAAGALVADGIYTIVFEAEDGAANRSAPQTRSVAAYGALARVRASTALFFPQDGDSLAPRVTFAFDLARAATVTWTVVDAAGRPVRTIMSGQPLAAGPRTFSWNGRNDAGAYVPRGMYTTVVRAVNGDLAATQAASVRADAFRIAASDLTPARRQRITVTITSAEALAAAPRLAVYQPGLSVWSVATVRVSARVYRVTITLRSSSTGTLRLKAYGRDSAGRAQVTNISLPLH